MKTIIVNAFGGPGAGKTTVAWELAAGLKKIGLVTEYVSEYAKELVWEEKFAELDGTITNQKKLYNEQKRRIDRLMGKVDVIVTDSPILLNLMYLKEPSAEYETMVVSEYKEYNNFNFFVERGEVFEQQGRMHSLNESIKIDQQIRRFLDKNEIYYGTYSHEKLKHLVNNVKKHHIMLNKEGIYMERQNKVNISISEKYVKTGLLQKLEDGSYREYNKVTLPPNTLIHGTNVSGYQFYPLYANPSVYNPNSIHIPVLKDRAIELHKGDDVIEVDPESLAKAINDSYLIWKKEHTQLGNMQQPKEEMAEKEFEWQGKSYEEYIAGYIVNCLEKLEGESISADELGHELMKLEGEQGLMFLGGQYEAREFIREHFYEAIDYKERFGEDLGIDPLIDSEQFAMGMVRESVEDMLNEIDMIAEAREFRIDIDVDEYLIGSIRNNLGVGTTLNNEKNLDYVME